MFAGKGGGNSARRGAPPYDNPRKETAPPVMAVRRELGRAGRCGDVALNDLDSPFKQSVVGVIVLLMPFVDKSKGGDSVCRRLDGSMAMRRAALEDGKMRRFQNHRSSKARH